MSQNPPPPPPQDPYGSQPAQPAYGQEGYPQQPGGAYPPQGYAQPGQPRGGSGMAITALVLGILALLISWVPVLNILGIVLALVAIVLGVIASRRAKRGEASGRGLAISGIVLGVLSIVIAIVVYILVALVFTSSGGKNYADCVSNANGDQAEVQKCAEEFQRNLTN